MEAADLLRLGPDARAYFAHRVRRYDSVNERIDQILAALVEVAPGFHYEATGNYDASEAFRRRQGNCMTFALLFTAIAREFGLRTVFHEVQLASEWEMQRDFFTEQRHVNVIVLDGPQRIEVDIRPWWRRELIASADTTVPDARACAAFYGNVAVERLAEGDTDAAVRLLQHATAVDPKSGVAWVNLANVLMRIGDMAAAQSALDRALALRPVELSAFSTKARLCQRTGQPELAARFSERAQRYRNRNPYYHFLIARSSLARGDAADAERHLRRALALKRDEPRFVELRIETSRRLGREADARRWAEHLAVLQGAGAN